MTIQDLLNAREFLLKVFVGRLDEERLIKTIKAIDMEITRRNKHE